MFLIQINTYVPQILCIGMFTLMYTIGAYRHRLYIKTIQILLILFVVIMKQVEPFSYIVK